LLASVVIASVVGFRIRVVYRSLLTRTHKEWRRMIIDFVNLITGIRDQGMYELADKLD
jgi:hypothetical protein